MIRLGIGIGGRRRRRLRLEPGTGVLRRSLAPLTMAALGTLSIRGALAATLGALTMQASGEGVLRRTASAATDWVIGSGHSLTDVWSFSGTWPGWWSRIRDSVFGVGVGGVRKHTAAGSWMDFRWATRNTGGDPDTEADSRTDIEDFDLLVITEAGAPKRPDVVGDREDYAERTLEHLFLFAENAWLNGRGDGAETMLHTYNTYTGGVAAWGLGFRESLVEYERSFHHMADHAADRMRREHPEVGADYRIWILPFHRLWMRVWDDLQTADVPGVATLAELFLPGDDIHPNATAGYGLACLAFAVIYQQDPAETPGFYVPPGYDPALRDYFWSLAWEIATTYQRAGLGGSIVGEPGYVRGVDFDHLAVPVSLATPAGISPTSGASGATYTLTLATWSGSAPITTAYTLTLGGVDVTAGVVDTGGVLTYVPATDGVLELTCTADNLAFVEAEATASAVIGDLLPAAEAVVTADEVTGLTWSPAMPAASGGMRRLAGTNPTITLGSAPVYAIVVLRPVLPQPTNGVEPIMVAHAQADPANWWMGDNLRFTFNPWTMVISLSAEAVPGGAGTPQPMGALEAEWMILEWDSDLTDHAGTRDAGAAGVVTTPRALGLTRFSFLSGTGGPLEAYDLAAVRVMTSRPTSGGKAALRAWAESVVAGV